MADKLAAEKAQANAEAKARAEAEAAAEVAASVAKAELAASKARAAKEAEKALEATTRDAEAKAAAAKAKAIRDAAELESELKRLAKEAAARSGRKICFLCEKDCAQEPRQRDDAGRYAHLACVQAKLKEQQEKQRRAAQNAAKAFPGEGGTPSAPASPVPDPASASASTSASGARSSPAPAAPASMIQSVLDEARAGDVTFRGANASQPSSANTSAFATPVSSPPRPGGGGGGGGGGSGSGRSTPRQSPGGPPGVNLEFFQSLAEAQARKKREAAHLVPNTPRPGEGSSARDGERRDGAGAPGSRAPPPMPPPELQIDGADLGAYWRRAESKGTAKDKRLVAEAIRHHFKLRDENERLLGVFECCKGETPDESGEIFVFSNFLCFRKDAAAFTPRGGQGGASGPFKPAPAKFAIPMASILDVSLNPGVYPFGAILVTIENVPHPWLFSFFTEREQALKCVRSARGYRGGGEQAAAMWAERRKAAGMVDAFRGVKPNAAGGAVGGGEKPAGAGGVGGLFSKWSGRAGKAAGSLKPPNPGSAYPDIVIKKPAANPASKGAGFGSLQNTPRDDSKNRAANAAAAPSELARKVLVAAGGVALGLLGLLAGGGRGRRHPAAPRAEAASGSTRRGRRAAARGAGAAWVIRSPSRSPTRGRAPRKRGAARSKNSGGKRWGEGERFFRIPRRRLGSGSGSRMVRMHTRRYIIAVVDRFGSPAVRRTPSKNRPP